jgi:molybdopterin molybdotransferase
MEKPFLNVMTSRQARDLLRQFRALDAEEVGIEEAVFRVLAEPVNAPEDLPGFDRSTMDGFAVRSSDTFGATESMPGLLNLRGEVAMGGTSEVSLKRGEAVRIWTGGALPANADAVVMIEHTEQLDHDTIEVLKAVAPFDNVVRKGEDFTRGELLLRAGHRLRPQDLGILAAIGRETIRSYKRPSVAVISSGDEIVPIGMEPPPGCIRDVNRYTLTACLKEALAIPLWLGLAPDSLKELSMWIKRGVQSADVVIISGGSSMGSRDLVIEAIRSQEDSEILLHGVSVSPGKPLIISRIGSKPVFGLPGHPVSAMVCFEQFVTPLLRRLEGEQALSPARRVTQEAFLGRNVPSKEGREDFVRVRIQKAADKLTAVPVPGKSGMISAMVRADGYIRISEDCEGLYRGDPVTVHLFSQWIEEDSEEEHISRHEAARGSSGDVFAVPQQEKLSKI